VAARFAELIDRQNDDLFADLGRILDQTAAKERSSDDRTPALGAG
jgi:hypothetical protein